MSIEISYFSKSSNNPNQPGLHISSESRSISGTSAQSGATPDGAVSVRIVATETSRVEYASAASVAASTSIYMLANAELWLAAMPGWKVAGITA